MLSRVLRGAGPGLSAALSRPSHSHQRGGACARRQGVRMFQVFAPLHQPHSSGLPAGRKDREEEEELEAPASQGRGLKVHSFSSELQRLALAPFAFATGSSASSSTQVLATAVGSVPAPLVGPLAVKALQILPPLACQAAFLAPLDAMKSIKATGTTGDLPLIPYASMALNGVLWVTYGLLKSDPTIWAPNITALAMGSYYWKTYANHTPADFNMTPYYAGGALVSAGIVGTALFADADIAVNALGLVGNGIVVLMFGGPLAAIKTVFRDKSTKALPFAMTIATFANCSLWFSYGFLVVHDPYIWFCNGLGLLSASVQIGLFAKYGIHRESDQK